MKKVNQILVLAALLVGTVSSFAQRLNGGDKTKSRKNNKILRCQ